MVCLNAALLVCLPQNRFYIAFALIRLELICQLTVLYNASNNELVRTKTLVKGTIVQIDSAPFRRWYENHYALPVGRKVWHQISLDICLMLPQATDTDAVAKVTKARSKPVNDKKAQRKQHSAVDAKLEEQFATGRLYGLFFSLLLFASRGAIS